jgi:hypothetical protein
VTLVQSSADGIVHPVTRVIACSAHQIPERAALRLAVGDRVTVGERDTEWPEFVFVTAAHGEGWVPGRYLSATSGDAIVHTPYDTTELSTQIGDVLEVVEEDVLGGWLWCRASSGQEGWVPTRAVRPVDERS